MRDLLDELARVRRNKVQAGLRELAGALSVVKLTNLACMEVNTIRPFFQAALDRFFRLRPVRAGPGSPAGGAGTPRPPHAPPHPSRLGAQKGARTLPFLYPSLSFPFPAPRARRAPARRARGPGSLRAQRTLVTMPYTLRLQPAVLCARLHGLCTVAAAGERGGAVRAQLDPDRQDAADLGAPDARP